MVRTNKKFPAGFPQFSTGSSPYPQKFAFPRSLMSHITSSVTSRQVYRKLTQTCKYFYSKNPVVVIEELDIYSQSAQIKNRFKNHYLDMKSLKNLPSKFWLTLNLSIYSLDAIDIATLNSKIYRTILVELNIDDVKLKYSDLELLSSKGTFSKVSLYKCDIVHDYPIDISDVVKLFRSAEKLDLRCFPTLPFTSETVRKLMDVPAFPNFKRLSLYNVPESLNLDEFIMFTNKYSNLWTLLAFSENIFENYKFFIYDSKEKLYNARIFVHV